MNLKNIDQSSSHDGTKNLKCKIRKIKTETRLQIDRTQNPISLIAIVSKIKFEELNVN